MSQPLMRRLRTGSGGQLVPPRGQEVGDLVDAPVLRRPRRRGARGAEADVLAALQSSRPGNSRRIAPSP